MPPLFSRWCNSRSPVVGTHKAHHLSEKPGGRAAIERDLDGIVASHYGDPDRFVSRMRRIGYPKAMAALAAKLPRTMKARSGHLGEILATEAVNELLPPFQVVLKRLRWLDGPESAMRGEDLIGLDRSGTVPRFLKGESKSRVVMSTTVLKEARGALFANDGRPSQHSLGFLADRLRDEGNDALAELIEDQMLLKPIEQRQLVHLMFVLTGNDASKLVEAELASYRGKIAQIAVSFRIVDHRLFIGNTYLRVGTYGP
jgi:hypothetical protein